MVVTAVNINADKEQKLVEYLEADSYVYARDIGFNIEQQYGVSYTLAEVIKLLHRLGFMYKKPKLIPEIGYSFAKKNSSCNIVF